MLLLWLALASADEPDRPNFKLEEGCCVHLESAAGNETVALADVRSVQHVVNPDGLDQAVLVGESQRWVVLSAPCAFVAETAVILGGWLGEAAVRVDGSGAESEAVCHDPFPDAVAYIRKREDEIGRPSDLAVPMVGLTIRKGPEGLASQLQELRPLLGRCGVPDEGAMVVKVKDAKKGRSVRVLTSSGFEEADRCVLKGLGDYVKPIPTSKLQFTGT